MAERTARTVWEGTLTDGKGEVTAESSHILVGVPVTWTSRVDEPEGRTSPEELLAAAHAACYAMALSGALARGDTPADRLEVTATVAFEKVGDKFKVTRSRLHVRGRVPGLDQPSFQDAARAGEQGCPISGAIRGNVDIELEAELDAS
ncbi:MAG TPA: OsmC family peroxiredoxin [Actinomycetota bacterium]|jgi:osmotically inducible protein OsmC|nr:OsmC family peroxiredoxin [Actinomycetota bacterium]